MVQLSQIPGGQCLGHHFDRRDKWQEGIASVAWSETAGQDDSRGDEWTLGMQCGPSNNVQRQVQLPMPAGAAYILSKRAQGRTAWCTRHKVAHESCVCCWQHGVKNEQTEKTPHRPVSGVSSHRRGCEQVWNEKTALTRQSITMRVYDEEWGREASSPGPG